MWIVSLSGNRVQRTDKQVKTGKNGWQMSGNEKK